MSVRVISIFSSKLYREYFLISKQISRYKISEKEISLEVTVYLLKLLKCDVSSSDFAFLGEIVSRTLLSFNEFLFLKSSYKNNEQLFPHQ